MEKNSKRNPVHLPRTSSLTNLRCYQKEIVKKDYARIIKNLAKEDPNHIFAMVISPT